MIKVRIPMAGETGSCFNGPIPLIQLQLKVAGERGTRDRHEANDYHKLRPIAGRQSVQCQHSLMRHSSAILALTADALTQSRYRRSIPSWSSLVVLPVASGDQLMGGPVSCR